MEWAAAGVLTLLGGYSLPASTPCAHGCARGSSSSQRPETKIWPEIPHYFPFVQEFEEEVYPCMGDPDQLGYTSLMEGVGVGVVTFFLRCLPSKYH